MLLISPIISILYWYFLKSEDNFSRRTVTLSFLIEGFGGSKAINFVKKYAAPDTELSVILKHCKHARHSKKWNIDWPAATKELKARGLI